MTKVDKIMAIEPTPTATAAATSSGGDQLMVDNFADLDSEIINATPEEIRMRVRLLDNEVRVSTSLDWLA